MNADLKEKIKKFPGMNLFVKFYKNHKIKKIYRIDAKYFINNYCYSSNISNNLDYRMMLEIHCLEKGMSVTNPRIFGIKHVNNLIALINLFDENDYDKSYTYNLGLSILDKYRLFFENKKWNDTENYKIVSKFLENKKFNITECGTITIYKDEIKKKYDIDYFNFMKSRKSVRNFKNKTILKKDMVEVLKTVQLTPSACNRQMCKLYSVENKEKKEKLSKKINGLTCFEKETLNYFVITYDQTAFFTIKERNQGFFNAGLFTMNFVNALHSKGIGSCILQGDNLPNDESELKKVLDIPQNEKICVFVVAGYYEDSFNVPVSPRKPYDEFYFKR